MTPTTSALGFTQEAFDAFLAARQEPDWARELRRQAWQQVQQMPRLDGEPCGLDQCKGARNSDGHKNHHPEFLNLSEDAIGGVRANQHQDQKSRSA